MKPRALDRRIQSLDDLIRQECGDKVDPYRLRRMLLQHVHLISVQIVSCRRIAYAEKLFILVIHILTYLFIGLLHTGHLKCPDVLGSHLGLLRKLVLNMDLSCFQDPTRSSYADLAQGLGYLFLKSCLDLHYGSGHSGYVMDLPVYHSPCRVLDRLLCNHNETVNTYSVSNRSHNTSCSNVQTKYITVIPGIHNSILQKLKNSHIYNIITLFTEN